MVLTAKHAASAGRRLYFGRFTGPGLRYTGGMSLEGDLEQLERTGHTVNRTPTKLADGRIYFHVDGLPSRVMKNARELRFSFAS